MGRLPLIAASCLVSFCTFPLSAQNGTMRLHGIPASVGSIGIDGRTHGIPASVTSPTFDGAPIQFNGFPLQFNHFGLRDRVFVPVYVPYAAYPYSYDAYYEPQPQPQPVQVVVQPVIIREVPEPTTRERRPSDDEAQSEDSSGYGERGREPREQARSERRRAPVTEQPAPSTEKTPKVAVPEELPVTTLIFRDGHHGEVRNYAIVGENLIDLSSRLMKKIPLSSLDLAATQRENEQNGIEFHLP